MAEQTQKPVVRFGVFEASLPSGELRKHGLLIRVPGQPFKILAILLERPGEVVTRDELRRSLWSAETFVDFEHSLNSAVKKLREALGDSAGNPRYIETLPRLGYRFIAPVSSSGLEATVEPAPQPASAPAVPHPRYRLAHPKLLAIACVILAAGGVIWFTVSRRPPLLTEQDSIVLADFENRTGDPAFDGTLKKVLEVEISQSPYLNVLPDQDVRQTLEYMRRRPDEPITKQVGLEICQRNSAKAMVSGSIASVGNRYVLTLEALNCATGGVLAGAQAEADSKERVLRALDDSTGKIRRNLGESLASIRKFGVPLEEATTGSLDALKMFALGDELRRQGKAAESIPFFKRAAELDPQFTLAYGRLGAVYANLSEKGLAKQYLEKAFQLRERTSERERLYLAARYYENVTGEAGKAIDNYEIWRNAYPRDWIPVNNLGNKYTSVGQYEKAIEVAREAVRLNPNHEFPYEVLARAYKRATRYAESKSICEDAIAKHLERSGLHSILYQIAFAARDTGAMQRQAEWGIGKPTEDETLMDEAWAAATAGRLRDSRELFRRAFAVARKNGFPDNAAAAVVSQGSIEAAFHNFREAKERATAALALPGAEVSDDAALVLARIGDLTRAESLADDLVRQYPLNTLVNEVSVPTIRAEVEIRRGQPARAVDLLGNAAPFELRDFTVPYTRGQAYLSARMGTDAAREFQKIVKNQGIDPISPYYPLAHKGLAESYALQGDNAASRREYEEFFALWKDADQDIPILREARSAYAELAQAKPVTPPDPAMRQRSAMK
jgi:DNA-binding winged helix-turn-helix (wHTH) protein/tetratricopeptide (TPR) repeat protein